MINKFIYIFSYGTLQDERLLKILNVKVYKSYDGILNNYAKFSDTSPYLGIIEYKNKFVTGKVLKIKKNDLWKIEYWEDKPEYIEQNVKVWINSENKFIDSWVYIKEPIEKYYLIDDNKLTNLEKMYHNALISLESQKHFFKKTNCSLTFGVKYTFNLDDNIFENKTNNKEFSKFKQIILNIFKNKNIYFLNSDNFKYLFLLKDKDKQYSLYLFSFNNIISRFKIKKYIQEIKNEYFNFEYINKNILKLDIKAEYKNSNLVYLINNKIYNENSKCLIKKISRTLNTELEIKALIDILKKES